MPTPEIYVSTDIEADGPIPGPYSMLSIGSAAFLTDGTLHSTFTANLQRLPGAAQDPETVEWFKREAPEAWQECQRHQRPPQEALAEYVAWARKLPGKPVFVAYPASYDFLFVYWYLRYFGLESPFKFHALDMRTQAMQVLGCGFWEANLPPQWRTPMDDQTLKRGLMTATGHPSPDSIPAVAHVALVDALHQGCWFTTMMKAAKDARRTESHTRIVE